MVYEGDYKEGDSAYYHEDGMILEVTVLGSQGDEKDERYKLQVRGILSQGVFSNVEVGEEFDCFKKGEKMQVDCGIY